MDEQDGEPRGRSRRRFLEAAAAVGITGVAGCNGLTGSGTETGTGTATDAAGTATGTAAGSAPEQIGSGRSPFGGRDLSDAVSMQEMPDLEGELTLYSGRGEALVGELIGYI